MAAPPTGMPADDIDGLLERYLGLLDEYTKLRSALTALQSSIYQNIARANFSAERGIRYGRDMYDERMQASRSLTITEREDDTPIFEVAPSAEEKEEARGPAEKEALGDGEKDTNGTGAEKEKEDDSQKAQKPRDPLRWFGILTPLPLRQAQSKSIEAVEEIIPKLATVNAQMADVEIRVRRARKKRAKAEAAAVKKEQQVLDGEEASVKQGAVDVSQAELEADVEKLALHDTGTGSENLIAEAN
ncbi:hypothetical protein GE09DRAFT_693119 [Coniochaeta sp. 2T2.1]|nr:hypothetical protein GE09DRAFT_693119 [Coniochaeta sp. 2T2.1]